MPHGLSTSLLQYQNDMDAHRDDYYGENGVFTKLCKAYEDKTYYESGMSPDVSLKETTAHEQYNYVISKLEELEHGVGVYLLNNYNCVIYPAVRELDIAYPLYFSSDFHDSGQPRYVKWF